MYDGTTRVTTGSIEEINRALYDLLKKINEQQEKIESMGKEIDNLKKIS